MPIENNHPAADQSIADDHALLSGLVSRIRSAIESGQATLAQDLLLQLARLYESHFEHEEAMMARSAYTALADHRREHRDLVGTLETINQTLRLENLHGLSLTVAAHLEAALKHTIETDQRFLDFMQRAA